MPQDQFFPVIGHLAEKANATPEDLPAQGGEQDDRPLEEGVTRMMLTSIPYFKEVIVMSFRCEHCGATNNEIQSAGTIRPEGVLYTLKVLHRADLDRQIVRSEACTIEIPHFELQLPPTRGQLTTVEGLLRDIVADLAPSQPLRRIQDEAAYTKIQEIIDGIGEILDDQDDGDDETAQTTATERNKDDPVKKVITIKFDDPSGNSFVEFLGSISDPKWSFKTYARSLEQNRALGILPSEVEVPSAQDGAAKVSNGVGGEGSEGSNEEVYEFSGVCSRCTRPLVTRMKKVSIPYFKPGTLGGRFTTVEGILEQVYEELSEKVYTVGDSGTMASEDRQKFQDFLKQLKEIAGAERPFTLILDDPLANSYVQNLYAPDPDPNLEIITYERTWQQNEELGLNDMRVDNYTADNPRVAEEDSNNNMEVKS
ncbi:hypothetical protein ID866_6851 [Astraeus odoratus]|nr:hypothetical protein ID866_6851 [Astraeus odoratus]